MTTRTIATELAALATKANDLMNSAMNANDRKTSEYYNRMRITFEFYGIVADKDIKGIDTDMERIAYNRSRKPFDNNVKGEHEALKIIKELLV